MTAISLPDGWSLQKALNMGMPDVKDDSCIICGKFLAGIPHSQHHMTPKGMGGANKIMTIKSASSHKTYKMDSSKISLCGSGTTGCHNDFHGGARLRITWEWASRPLMRMWFDGLFLDSGFIAHDKRLWEMGCYAVYERQLIQGRLHERRIMSIFASGTENDNDPWEVVL